MYGYTSETPNIPLGTIVRYGEGSTALARLTSRHAGGYHGRQCLGGSIFISGNLVRPATKEEIEEASKSKFYILDTDIEIKAEIYRVIRSNQDKNPKKIFSLIKEHLPKVSNQTITDTLIELVR